MIFLSRDKFWRFLVNTLSISLLSPLLLLKFLKVVSGKSKYLISVSVATFVPVENKIIVTWHKLLRRRRFLQAMMSSCWCYCCLKSPFIPWKYTANYECPIYRRVLNLDILGFIIGVLNQKIRKPSNSNPVWPPTHSSKYHDLASYPIWLSQFSFPPNLAVLIRQYYNAAKF